MKIQEQGMPLAARIGVWASGVLDTVWKKKSLKPRDFSFLKKHISSRKYSLENPKARVERWGGGFPS